MNIIILGPQGSGKGTQARLLIDELKLYYFETGGFLRDLAQKDREIDEMINKKGDLLPDEKMFSLVRANLEENTPTGEGILFDGYPRSIKQYDLLETWLKEKKSKIDYAFLLKINKDESLRRLSARRICSVCGKLYNLITEPPTGERCLCGGKLMHREDDKPEAIKRRLNLYEEETKPLVDVYQKEGILREVNGERPVEIIHADIMRILGRKKWTP
jgi:adenylate kinase